MKLNRQEVLTYLSETRQLFLVSQRYKETSAWVSIGTYFILVAVLVRGGGPLVSGLARFVVLAAVIAIAFILYQSYLPSQFKQRKFAAIVVAACAQLYTELMADPDASIDSEEFKLLSGMEEQGEAGLYLPKIVLQRVGELRRTSQTSALNLEDAARRFVVIGAILGGLLVLMQ